MDASGETMAALDVRNIKQLYTTDARDVGGNASMRRVVEAYERLDALYHDDGDEGVIASLTRVVKCAMDSGACGSVIQPDILPSGVVPSGNPAGQVSRGATISPIRRFGHAVTTMKNGNMDVGCGWQVAEVTRPLNSVEEVWVRLNTTTATKTSCSTTSGASSPHPAW